MLRIHQHTELLMANYPLPEINGVGLAQLLRHRGGSPHLVIVGVVNQELTPKEKQMLPEDIHESALDAVLETRHSKQEMIETIECHRYKRLFPNELLKDVIPIHPILTIQSDGTIESAISLALRHPELQMIPVTQDGKLIGFIETKALLNPGHWGEGRNSPVSNLMKPNSPEISLDISTPISQAIDRFAASPTFALFVCDGQRLAGIVYPSHLLQYLKEQLISKLIR